MALGDWSNWSEKRRLGVTAGAVGVIVAIMAGLVAWVYSQYRALERDVTTETTAVAKLGKRAKDPEKRRKARIEAYRKDQERRKELPDEPMAQGLRSEINRLSGESGLSLQEIAEVADKAKAGRGRKAGAATRHKKTKMRLLLIGSYDSLGRFINGLEDDEKGLKRLVEVSSFKISGQDDGTVPGAKNLEIELEIGAYYSLGAAGTSKKTGRTPKR